MKQISYPEVIQKLEALSIMPKTMPGLEKLRQALQHKTWFSHLNPQKIITVAGTNGKGTTCAALQTLLLSAGQNVGLYTSPHLISTTERIRVNGQPISETAFVELFISNQDLIEKFELTHFESLTLMASDYFFSKNNLDFVIFEVGLGGTFDATNVFPNYYSVITALGMDHQNILGNSIIEIARNKFGIIKNKSKVFHHVLPQDVLPLFSQVLSDTQSVAIPAEPGSMHVEKKLILDHAEPQWVLHTPWGKAETNLPGLRACENIMTALTVFAELGFEPSDHLQGLKKIDWKGRMQKIMWSNLPVPIYLSGDHNVQGVQSLLEILHHYEWHNLHLIVGIGQDKSYDDMLELLMQLPRVRLYLTQTPFKGLSVMNYSERWRLQSVKADDDIFQLLDDLASESQKLNPKDLVVVTGSLYLVGKVLSSKKALQI